MTMKPDSGKGIRLYPLTVIVFLVIFAIVPLIVAMAISNGTPEDARKQPSFAYVVAIHVERTDDHSITITNLGGEGKPRLNKDQPFKVFINNLDATNASTIKNHTALAIAPETGLGYATGSAVTYSGEEVSTGKAVRILVLGNFDRGITSELLDTIVLSGDA